MPTKVSAPFPDLDLEEKTIIEVDTGDAAAIITRMVIHFTQDVPDLPAKLVSLPPVVTYGPAASVGTS